MSTYVMGSLHICEDTINTKCMMMYTASEAAYTVIDVCFLDPQVTLYN